MKRPELSATFTAQVEAAMRKAAQTAILPRYQSLAASDIVNKAPDDVVTVADKESEEILGAALADLLPEATIVGEEAAFADPAIFARLREGLCWIVDPLDGTNNFAEGKAPFGVLVALADGGETIGGWILDCLSGRFCHASSAGGAFIDGNRISARSSGEEPPVAALATGYMQPEERAAVQKHIAPLYRTVDIPRCAAEQYPRLALGTNDVSVFNRTLPWDHAAGVLFLNEAGGRAARLDGTAYRVDEWERRGMIGASTPQLWDVLAGRLAKLER
ncbi:fructose-1,6-bisphosphatase/inositol monophosphatase family enzyme [Novosphingobium chloroacetimidivorans]|uniref:Fructose-1,6-bisphosphatase/inositol monophosphatase family enzyme n=1 Tax=Novosphingobium chloroacetimidivorans TaxID=1428314 RepID=A0A7W7KCS0_9SPHN|nr:inositol monophosphatase family protein [Novosphingobium chloroacetimidivorans]MBB4859828.1 fructose-1,6-bisphosphatase/inositol monophosphatase family enzyme [Novosphingobium chloroacetimidivorans]